MADILESIKSSDNRMQHLHTGYVVCQQIDTNDTNNTLDTIYKHCETLMNMVSGFISNNLFSEQNLVTDFNGIINFAPFYFDSFSSINMFSLIENLFFFFFL